MPDRFETSAANYYTCKLLQHGSTPAGVDWNSAESQNVRFEQLMRITSAASGFSLLDFGCGYGALLTFLDNRGMCPSYWGYDAAPAMVAKARDLHKDGNFVSQLEGVPPVDYAVASGVFHVKQEANAEEWRSYVLETLLGMAALSTRGLAFNLLTSYSDRDRMREYLYYADPCFFFDFCKTRISRHVALLHDYGLYEFTMLVRME
ncbi:MAG: methyltransferase domain-containing protein [Bryobacteraceae bacterium]|jgi:SAM-dependent methyltransferase